tara:strand:+ start:4208 stop:4537 length:330 start_codon:yes stop_codon:yes gene_type:complete
MFENRRWLVIPTNLTESINFNQIHQSSIDKLRVSNDGTQTFVKYEVNIVTSSFDTTYNNPETEEDETYTTEAGVYGRPDIYSSSYSEYNHTEILNVLTGSNWVTEVDGK